MTLTALTSTEQPGRVLQRSRLLVRVIAWELRRLRASRLLWLQALGFFALSLFLTWSVQIPLTLNHMKGTELLYGFVAGTSAWGLFMTLSTGPLMLLGMLLPFVNADGVTRDRARRTHELLLTTALPTWAYVWGRYLAGLLMSLGLALLMLVSILLMGGLLHLTVTDYPLPQIGAVLLLWVSMVFPATILVSSVGFALSTLLPRLSTLVKVVILVTWIVGAEVIPRVLGNHPTLPAWYVNWDPTSGITTLGLLTSYSLHLSPSITSEAQLQQFVLSMENKMPDLAGWFVPHLGLSGFSLLLVLIAAFAFKRTRDTLN